jgi:hypothetical protein
MQFRNDLCCKNKFRFDLESAGSRWGSHPGGHLYLCTECGFIHFARDKYSRIDRLHGQALRIEAHRRDPPVFLLPKKKLPFSLAMPKTFAPSTTCRVKVWKAAGSSIGELLALKGIRIAVRPTSLLIAQ